MSFVPLLNGIEHAHADVQMRIYGQLVAGITSFNYSEDRKMDNIYGMGDYPVSQSSGPRTFESSITFLMTELVALQKAAPNGDITRLPRVDIIVSYLPIGSTQQVTDIIHNVKFKKNSRTSNQGDDSIKIEVPLLISHITWGT